MINQLINRTIEHILAVFIGILLSIYAFSPISNLGFDYIIYGILLFFTLSFFAFHGVALFQVISNYKVITHVYSFEYTYLCQFIFLITGLIICYYFFLFLIKDLMERENSLFAFFIISYLGIFTLYTIRCSFRYYLILYALMFIYLALKSTGQIRTFIPLFTALGISILITNYSLFCVFNRSSNFVKPVHIRIGSNNQIENSAHFLPNTPLIEFLRTHKISKMYFLSDRYFIEQPILFYNLNRSWEQIPGSSATIVSSPENRTDRN